jgi:hypothetical protein
VSSDCPHTAVCTIPKLTVLNRTIAPNWSQTSDGNRETNGDIIEKLGTIEIEMVMRWGTEQI